MPVKWNQQQLYTTIEVHKDQINFRKSEAVHFNFGKGLVCWNYENMLTALEIMVSLILYFFIYSFFFLDRKALGQ